MKTRVIQDEPKQTEAVLPVPDADHDAAEMASTEAPDAPEQNVDGAKP